MNSLTDRTSPMVLRNKSYNEISKYSKYTKFLSYLLRVFNNHEKFYGLARTRMSDPGASVRMLLAQGTSERLARRARRAASHFPRATHVQHSDPLLKYPDATVTT
jgi:hypothetical protein